MVSKVLIAIVLLVAMFALISEAHPEGKYIFTLFFLNL
jgi:hypothetical protein